MESSGSGPRELGLDDTTRWIMGRLKPWAPENRLRGFVVRARAGGRVLDSSVTTGAGRFLLSWSSGHDETTSIELLDANGDIAASTDVDKTDLVSPPVVVFSPARMPRPMPESGERDLPVLLADGDHPVCIASSCADVTLSWTGPIGTKVAILSEGKVIKKGLEPVGSLRVSEAGARRYTMKAEEGELGDSVVEVRRCPTLALVMQGTRFERGTLVDFGLSISCPAGPGGLVARLLTSDPGVIAGAELAIPEGHTWGSTRVNAGKPGKVEVTACAPGYSRDGVSFFVV